MPEYLAPGVYPEIVETGPRPIEGVSTTDAAMVGVAERGPVNRAILLTSIGDFDRWFGGRLPLADFRDPADPDRAHCYLRYAAEGYFENGGKRLRALRVAPEEARAATATLHDRGAPLGGDTVLLRRAAQGSGGPGGLPLYLFDTTSIGNGDTVRVGDGSAAEYRVTSAAPTGATRHVPLNRPLTRAHGTAANTVAIGAPASIGAVLSLDANVAAGAAVAIIDSSVDLTLQALPIIVRLSENAEAHLAAVVATAPPVSLGGNLYRVVLNEPCPVAFTTAAAVDVLTSNAVSHTLEVAAAPGDPIVFADTNVPFAAEMVEFEPGTPAHEVREMGELTTLTLDQPATRPAPIGTQVAQVTLADDGAITAKATTADAAAGARVIALNDRVGLVAGTVLRIGAGPDTEYAEITALPGAGGAAPDAGTVTLGTPLARDHATGTVAQAQLAPAAAGADTTGTVLPAAAMATDLTVAAGQALAAGDGLAITTPDGVTSFHTLGATNVPANTGFVPLTEGVLRSHEVGAPAVERGGLLNLFALNVGSWGNRLVASVADEADEPLVRTTSTALNAPLEVRVTALTNIEPGTLLQLRNPATGGIALVKVRGTNPATRAVLLDPPGLDAVTLAQLGALAGPLEITSREFSLTVRLLARPDPAAPGRAPRVERDEIFRHLTLDHRHPRYVLTDVGDINAPPTLEDGQPEGNSQLIRIGDTAPNLAATEAIREAPEALTDITTAGLRIPAQQAFDEGDDSLATISDLTYLGQDATEPLDRTGLQATRNVRATMIAIPGQASPLVQAGLIAHCESQPYRFAVLDTATPDASLADVQLQRSASDSQCAALYYPWMHMPNPDAVGPADPENLAIPPSGAMMGIYARTDVERGVHVAPANKVIRGITGFSRRVNTAEQEVLNASPTNICALRDFSAENRGLRVWGARVITSNSQYRYISTVRLMFFLQESIEIGLQYVVFEPNAPALWARVTSTVRNFLTDVWRDGALQGRTPEQGFYVKCDETTMTQSDIDNGRLIVLIGVAPVFPAEFVILRFALDTARVRS